MSAAVLSGGPDWTAIHAAFPINQKLIWLNNCGIAAMPGPVVTAMEQHFRALAAGGIFATPTEAETHDQIRDRLAALLNCARDELALCHNTNEAMSFLSHGVDLAPGDEILLMENEYPSNVYPWQHWQGRGVKLGFIPLAPTPAAWLGGFEARLSPRTRVVAMSAVHWCTGMPLPIAEVGQIAASRGIDLFVDGAQGVGLVDLDVRAAGITAMGFSAWKWLLGPLGLAAFYVRKDRLSGLRFPFKGTGSVVNDEVYLPYREQLKPGAERYVLSTPNFNDWIYFSASLAFLDGLGMAAVRARIHALADHLAWGLRRAGFSLTRDAFPELPTGIIAAEKPGHDSAKLVAQLRARGIVAAERLGRIRLAPHVFILEAQLDEVVKTLAELTR